MDQVHVVRHKVLVEGQQIRRVAREMGIARNTVKRYLERPAPVRVETEARARPVWEKVGPRVEALLSESPRWTGGKALLARLDDAHDADRFAAERAHSLPLATHRFDARRTHVASVSQRSLVRVEGATYSVPCLWAGLDVTAHVGTDDVAIVGHGSLVTRPRARFGERVVDYRDYVRELAKKPQAVRQVAAELIRDLGPPFERAWRTLVDAHGPKQAARVFAKVLGYVETRGVQSVAAALERAFVRNEPLLLALAPSPTPTVLVARDALPTSLREVDVASGSAADYDAWLVGGAS